MAMPTMGRAPHHIFIQSSHCLGAKLFNDLRSWKNQRALRFHSQLQASRRRLLQQGRQAHQEQLRSESLTRGHHSNPANSARKSLGQPSNQHRIPADRPRTVLVFLTMFLGGEHSPPRFTMPQGERHLCLPRLVTLPVQSSHLALYIPMHRP